MEILFNIFFAGLFALEDYIATHVLTCLIPAFLLAGAMVTFINRELVLDYLGEKASKLKSFSIASGSSFLLAACSCTVIPVASGLYYAGAGIGAAFIVLWVAPASNILALVYTGNILGAEMVVARVVAALLMAFVVGTVMTVVFSNEKMEQFVMTPSKRETSQLITKQELILLLLLILTLLLPNYLITSGPYGYKVLVWLTSTLVMAIYAWKVFSPQRIRDWLKESWWFVRTIFPLLIGGVFLVGIIGELIPETWIRQWLSGNGILASFLATLLGSVTYFATMTEAPFVDTLMAMGMGKGPALTLLLTGPGISLPNWLAVARVFGLKKALVYVPVIIASGTFMGWFFGNFIL